MWTERFTNKYIEKVNNFTKKYTKTLYKFLECILKIKLFLVKLINMFINLCVEISKALYNPLVRYITFPFHKLWILGWIELIYKGKDKTMPFPKGMKYIQSKQGGGKSSFMYHFTKWHWDLTGKGSYINVSMEKPKFTYDQKLYVENYLFILDDFFENGEMVYRFETEKNSCVIIDEFQQENSYRRNKTSLYLERMEGMEKFMTGLRHQHMDHVWVASQLNKNDITVMQLLVAYYTVKVKKGFDYKKWLEDGKFRITIQGWKMQEKHIDTQSGIVKLIDGKKFYIPRKFDLDDFETLNKKGQYAKLPVYKPHKTII